MPDNNPSTPSTPSTRYPRRRALLLFAGAAVLTGSARGAGGTAHAEVAPVGGTAPPAGLGSATRDRYWRRQADHIRRHQQRLVREMERGRQRYAGRNASRSLGRASQSQYGRY